MQVNADWSTRGTAAEAEKQLKGFKFAGPGWYITDMDCMLVIADERHPSWKQQWPEEQIFRFYIYNCPFHETVFGARELPPTLLDSR